MNKKIMYIIAVLLLSTSVGCITVKQNKPEVIAPDDIKAMALRAKEEAKQCIEQNMKNIKLKDVCSVRVEKINGEYKDGGMWLFMVPGYKSGAGGVTRPDPKGKISDLLIQIGCNPKTGSDISYEALKHEFGHAYLISNHHNYKHDEKVKGCFIYWKDGYTIKSTNSLDMIVDIVE